MSILSAGSKIGLITTSKAVYQISDSFRTSKQHLEQIFGIECILGKQFAKPIEGIDPHERVQDLNDFIRNPEIDLIMAHSGGRHANELLPFVDRKTLRKTKKPFCGYSDNTVRNLAWYTQGGSKSYTGPHFRTFEKTSVPFFEKTQQRWKKLMFGNDKTITLKNHTPYFSHTSGGGSVLDDNGIKVLHAGQAKGIVLGGNISTICSLNGTTYAPDRSDKILLIEECEEMNELQIRRMLFSLRMQTGMNRLAGVLVGRFSPGCERGQWLSLDQTLLDVFGDLNIPIVKNFCFGHISPFQTIPIGTLGTIDTQKEIYTIACHSATE